MLTPAILFVFASIVWTGVVIVGNVIFGARAPMQGFQYGWSIWAAWLVTLALFAVWYFS